MFLRVNSKSHAENVHPLPGLHKGIHLLQKFFPTLDYTPAFFLARSSLWQMHCPPFYSKKLIPEFPVSKSLSERLHSVTTEKPTRPLGVPWGIPDCCMVPADATHTSDTLPKSH